jgi:hypothetical protein
MTKRLGAALAALFLAVAWPAAASAAQTTIGPGLLWTPVDGIDHDFTRPCVVGAVTSSTAQSVTFTLVWDEKRDATCALSSDEDPAARLMLWKDLGDPGHEVSDVMGPYNAGNAVVPWTEFYTDPVTITVPGPGRYFGYFEGSWYGIGYVTVGQATATPEPAISGGTPGWVVPAVVLTVLAAGGTGWYLYRARAARTRAPGSQR